MELIDRKKAIYHISNYMREGGFMELSDFDIASLLLEVPTIESRPKGKWIECGGGVKQCSVCNDFDIVKTVYKYCPNCGADMEGEE